MRLIDADMLRNSFESADFDDDCFENCDNAVRITDSMPTVPAITIDWLKAQQGKIAVKGDPIIAETIGFLIRLWQMEQES